MWLKEKSVLALLVVVVLLQTSELAAALAVDRVAESEADLDMSHNWAVIVVGSNDWSNYRHHADGGHAYHILRERQFQPDKIILMMYNDVPTWDENPTPGKLFNNYSHIDVYANLVIDYQGKEVTPEMFLKVLQGDQELVQQGKKVLNTKADDTVFLIFFDHGAPELIAFPNDDLYAKDLHEALLWMHENARYRKLIFYIEACESGSMFKDYPPPPNMYVTTAANADESSWACLCDDPDEKFQDICFGDCYSLNWMNDTERHSTQFRTLDDQLKAVRALTNRSHVQQFGDKKMGREKLSVYQGVKKQQQQLEDDEKMQADEKVEDETMRMMSFEAMPANRVHLLPLYKRIQRSSDPVVVREAQRQLHEYQQRERRLLSLFEAMADRFVASNINSPGQQATTTTTTREQILRRRHDVHSNTVGRSSRVEVEAISDCYKRVTQRLFRRCFRVNQEPTLAENLHKLHNMCRLAPHHDSDRILPLVDHFCASAA